MEKDKKFVYVGLIIILIGILTIRVFKQGEKINKSIDKVQKEGISIEYKGEDKKEKDEKISLSETFSNKNINLKYPSDWQQVEDDQILNLFNPGNNQADGDIPNIEQFSDKQLEELESISTPKNKDSAENNEMEGEILFMAMKNKIPQFSLGVVSLQKLELKENNLKTLENEMEAEFQTQTENSEKEIINKEKGEDYITMEVVTSVGDRNTFKSKNIGFVKNKKTYLISFNSTYDNWKDFKNEFDLILSSIEFNND